MLDALSPQANVLSTRCCIVGDGPAGMMAGWLPAFDLKK
jgi:hypothetical protein